MGLVSERQGDVHSAAFAFLVRGGGVCSVRHRPGQRYTGGHTLWCCRGYSDTEGFPFVGHHLPAVTLSSR